MIDDLTSFEKKDENIFHLNILKKSVRKPRSHFQKKFLNEISSLQKNLKEEKLKSEEYLSQLQYLQADFDNYLKKFKKDVEDQVKRAYEKLVINLLPVIDDFEKAIELNNHNPASFQEGIKMILKEIKDILIQEGLSEIQALGKTFDPTKHEAVEQIETSEYPEDIVVKVLRKGYIFNGRVLRTSLVTVSKPIITH